MMKLDRFVTDGRYYVKAYYVRGRLKGYRVFDGETDGPVKNGLFIAKYEPPTPGYRSNEFNVALHLANTMRDDLNANIT